MLGRHLEPGGSEAASENAQIVSGQREARREAREATMAATGLEFKNVVFNAARDGKLRRLKVCRATRCQETTAHKA